MLWLPYSALLLCDSMQARVVLARRIPRYSPGTENSSGRYFGQMGENTGSVVETIWFPNRSHKSRMR
jgi:hypothetical protein